MNSTSSVSPNANLTIIRKSGKLRWGSVTLAALNWAGIWLCPPWAVKCGCHSATGIGSTGKIFTTCFELISICEPYLRSGGHGMSMWVYLQAVLSSQRNYRYAINCGWSHKALWHWFSLDIGWSHKASWHCHHWIVGDLVRHREVVPTDVSYYALCPSFQVTIPNHQIDEVPFFFLSLPSWSSCAIDLSHNLALMWFWLSPHQFYLRP